MLTKVVFIGAMSSGKSTLAEALAERYATTFAPEYGREYWTENQADRRIALEEFNTIERRHIEGEVRAARDAKGYLVVDTDAITTYMYSIDYHGRVPDYLERLAQENASRDDLFFLCGDDIP